MASVLGTSASALSAGNDALSIIGRNLAYSEGLGVKPMNGRFIVTEAGNTISSGNFTPGTVSVTAVQNNDIMGVLSKGTLTTHLAFDSPQGYFVVTSNPDDPSSDIRYTRAGDFATDRFGNLQNSAGDYLLGVPLEDDGSISAGVNPALVDDLEVVNVSRVGGTFTETDEIEAVVNLRSGAPTGDNYIVAAQVVGSQGVPHNVSIEYIKTANPNEWSITITSPDAAAVTQFDGPNATNPYANVLVQFNGAGELTHFNGVPADTTPPTILFDWNGGEDDAQVTLNVGGDPADAGFEPENAMRIAGVEGARVRVDSNGQEFNTVESTFIDSDGSVFAVFRNSTQLRAYEIRVANFDATNFLEPQSGNSFSETNKSGGYVLSSPGSGGTARIIPSTLESNPTDIAAELTQLIRIQQYSIAQTHPLNVFTKITETLNRII